MLNQIFDDYMNELAMLYIGDHTILRQELERHYSHLEIVLPCINYSLVFGSSKEFEFFLQDTDSADMKSRKWNWCELQKIDTLLNWPNRRNVSETRSFRTLVVFSFWYSNFCKDCNSTDWSHGEQIASAHLEWRGKQHVWNSKLCDHPSTNSHQPQLEK